VNSKDNENILPDLLTVHAVLSRDILAALAHPEPLSSSSNHEMIISKNLCGTLYKDRIINITSLILMMRG